MSRSREPRPHSVSGGFTLLEVMVSTLIFATVSVAVMGAFVFLGTSMTRMLYAQQLEENSRRAFYLFNQDVGMATKVTTATDTTLALTTASATTVTYTYDSSAQTVTRTAGGTSTIILKNLTVFDFNYFNNSGTVITVPQSPSSSYKPIKAVQFSFTATLGTTTSSGASIYRTTSSFQTVSPMVFMRNTAVNGLLP